MTNMNISNPFTSSGLFHHNSLHPMIAGCVVSFLLQLCFIQVPALNANNVDPDQLPRSAESDLGVHVCKLHFLGFPD